MGFWDDPSVKPAGGAYMKFEKAGDSVAGTIAKLGKRVFGKDEDERVAVEISWVEPDVPTLTAGQARLASGLYELRPMPGDHLRITMTGIEKLAGGKTLKTFDLELKRKDGSVEKLTK